MRNFQTNGMQIVNRIDKILHTKSLTRVQLAPVVGITPATISAWSTRGTIPAADVALRISDFLGVSIEWLITGEAPESVPPGTLALAKDIEALPEEYREIIRHNVEDFKSLCLRSAEGAEKSGTA